MIQGKPITPSLRRQSQQIIDGYVQGSSLDNLGVQYQCSASSIRRLLLSHNVLLRAPIRSRVLSKFRHEVLAYYRTGASLSQIANRFNVDRNTAGEFIRKNGISRGVGLSSLTFHITSDSDKGMLAGLLLGEGSIILGGNRVCIRIVNQDAAILGWLAKFGGRLYWSKPRHRSPNPCGVWDLSGSVDVYHCLSSIHHLLVGKKKSLCRAGLKLLESRYSLKL